ncbi:hypothetical protein [Amycolatopsis regifaucium]|uniref:Uncharacterized protein n=1 Tax=Amycolatopsis regifaucium TaxID=546365 RepID=A0A154MJA1_9PSEU|nr:hypothetical protein [Amycolatopsis regifaucium]KZB84494.1 hypothetical protein AVL48_32400 [Amycolatopsis regifaucium]OKA10956.1 hypothetical protein ATP06_0202065 [Amycolatopsis regifaucium]SFI23411.1 hypothetical protein SAMN04489731_109158 [Amycolatopsis regifaucium]
MSAPQQQPYQPTGPFGAMQPVQTPVTAPRPPSDARLPRLFAAMMGVFAGLLILVATFLPQSTYEQISEGKTVSKFAETGWARSFDIEPSAEEKEFYDKTHVARYGIPLSAAALTLFAGAAVGFASYRRNSGSPAATTSRTLLIAGGAGTAFGVWMLGMDISASLSFGQDTGRFVTRYGTGGGFWILLAGGLVALLTLALAIVAHRREPVRAPQSPYPVTYSPYPQSAPQQQYQQQPPRPAYEPPSPPTPPAGSALQQQDILRPPTDTPPSPDNM